MVYYYFPTKDDLFLEVVEETYGKLLADMTRALGPDVPVKERIRRLYARVGAISRRRALYRAAGRCARCWCLRVVASRLFGALSERTLAAGHRHADGRSTERRFCGTIFPRRCCSCVRWPWGRCPSCCSAHSQGRGPLAALPPGDALGDRLVDVLFSGLRAKKSRAKVKRTPAEVSPV